MCSYGGSRGLQAPERRLAGAASQTNNSNPQPVYSYTVSNYDSAGNLAGYVDSSTNPATGVTNPIMGNWSFTYDPLNRLVAGTASTGTYSGQNMCWTYDDFGNRTAQSQQIGACSTLSSSTMVYNTNNQVSGVIPPGGTQPSPSPYTYDQAGNVTNDAVADNQYLYDAEGRICAVYSTPGPGIAIMTQYLYDAEGNRVAKGSITNWSAGCDTTQNGFTPESAYVLGPGGEQLTEMTYASGGWQWLHTNVEAGGLSATYDADLSGKTEGVLYFHLSDWLGTRRQQTDYAGNPCLNFTGLPFGDGLTTIPIPCLYPDEDATEHHFTGKERDTESGNDYFGARYYASTMGRFLSPDWSAKQDPVPYARLDNPQTLNLYAYLRNNPLAGIDADGHCSGDDCGKVTVTATPEKQPAPVHETTLTDKDGNQHTGTGPTANLHMTVSVNGTPTDGVHVTETNQATMTTPTLTTTGRPVIDGTVDSKNGGKYADVVGPEIPSSKMSSAAAANAYNTTPVTLVDKQTQTLQIPGQGGQPGFTCEATSTRTVTNTADGKTISPNGYTLTTTQPVVRSPQPTQ